MFVYNYDRKKFVDDHRQKYTEITKNCLGIEIADEHLRFLQTKHLQCSGVRLQGVVHYISSTSISGSADVLQFN